MQHTFAQISNAIKTFEQDWDQRPKTLTELTSIKSLREMASAKKVSLPPQRPYLTGLPETDGILYSAMYQCPLYSPATPSHANINEGTFNSYKNNSYYNNPNSTYKTYDKCYTYFSSSGCNRTLIPANNYSNASNAEKRIMDEYGNPIYYYKDDINEAYLLVSPGPDKKFGTTNTNNSSNEKIYEGTATYADYTNTQDEQDKDNIIFQSNG
jgi:hypothetical protein